MEQLQDLKDTYYEYIGKVGSGCLTVANLIRAGHYQDAFQGIIDFAEGMQWAITVEASLQEQGYVINSRIAEASELLTDVNEALETQDMITVADLFEYEIHPLFSSASEWIFTKQSEE